MKLHQLSSAISNRVQSYLRGHQEFKEFGAGFQRRNPEEHSLVGETFKELRRLKAATLPLDGIESDLFVEFVDGSIETMSELRGMRDRFKSGREFAQVQNHPEDAIRYRAAEMMLADEQLMSSTPLTRNKAAAILKKARQEVLG